MVAVLRGAPLAAVLGAVAGLGVFVLLAGLVMNPYFLNLLSLSYFLFLVLGFALADADVAARARPVALASPRQASHQAYVSVNEPIAPQ